MAINQWGSRLFPFLTEKLNPLELMVLQTLRESKY